MASSSLHSQSSSSSSRLASGRLAVSQARAGSAVRWGAAVVEPARKGASHCWQKASSHVRSGRRTTVWMDQASRKVARHAVLADASGPVAGGTFTQNRIRHAFELFGACMMIVTFLALAMFA